MRFPERPTVHENNRWSHESSWRPPRDGDPHRTCSYCGSIHPEDLLAAVRAGGKMHGSDWKYGYPHKFYVDVPNPDPERLFEVSISYDKDGNREAKMGKMEMLFGKFYSEHLLDDGYDEEALKVLCDTLERHTGIRFERKPVDGKDKLWYHAPYCGYQR